MWKVSRLETPSVLFICLLNFAAASRTYWKEKLFHYLKQEERNFFLDLISLLARQWRKKSLINVRPSPVLLMMNRYKFLTISFFCCRFKLTTTKFAVIVKRAAQESIYRVYVCHQTQRHNQLPQWDSTLSSERSRHGSATVTASSSTHKETVFR